MEKPSATADIVLDDGILRFKIKPSGGTDADVKTCELDVLLLKMTCEQCERAHSLESKDGQVFASVEFLRDLAARLKNLGVENCSATVACQLWKQSYRVLDGLKKNTNETPNSPSGSTSNRTAKGRKAKSQKGKR